MKINTNIKHVINPLNDKERYHLDGKYQLWSCDCENQISLCLSQCSHLQEEGEYNELRRKVAEKRKEMGLLQTLTVEDIERILKNYDDYLLRKI